MIMRKTDGKWKSVLGKTILVLVILALLGFVILGVLNLVVINSSKKSIYSLDIFETSNTSHFDAVIVMGCAVWDDGPSPMLADRLRTAAAVYKTGCADYILVTGDSEEVEDYDETGAMRQFLIDEGIPTDNIICDPLGLSTYESMMRAVKISNINTAVVVTTGFHCPRSVYDSRMFGIESVGVSAINSGYVIKQYNYYREFIARGKDFVFCLVKPGY